MWRSGIIPANTGKIIWCIRMRRRPWDHPREYGENFRESDTHAFEVGSSPRIRGKSFRVGVGGPRRGIIPANTGKICDTQLVVELPADHPREYGENPIRVGHPPGPPFGSSPRIRGKCVLRGLERLLTRIIPAIPGKRVAWPRNALVVWDHPREYGENPGPMQILGERTRIIPANTGKITWHNRDRCWVRDHPREYGENASALSWSYVVAGSSPRIRGKYPPPGLSLVALGIIPANTGKIFSPRPQRFSTPDHPREYGENSGYRNLGGACAGSSPRIRGKL